MIDEAREREVVGAVPTQLFIDGAWISAEEDATFEVEDPSTLEILAEVADASPADGLRALKAAADAQSTWAATAPRHRSEILRRAYELIMERQEDLAVLMTLEMGKPLSEAMGEVAYAAEFFRWFSEEAVRVDGGFAVAPNGQGRLLVMREPVGPCLLITPWNFPLAMGTRKIGPAIAAGCTMVVKPAHQTPLSTLALADIMVEAGLPAGVLNVITTSHAGQVMEPMIRDGRARKLSFTGSTAVGRILLEQCAANVMRTSMELGGNAPFIVFDDADLGDAVEGAILAKMRNIGEACTAANRLYVQSSVAEEFSRRLGERMGALPVGRGVEDGVVVGPLIDADALDKVSSLVDDAVSRGAEVVVGGSPLERDGHYYPATVLTGVPPEARIRTEEIFGPVAPVATFETEDEVVDLANDTEYGLVAYVFTRDLDRALRVCERLDTGMIGLNQGIVSNPAAPFGGVKQSGLGREGGRSGIEEFLETKYVAIATKG
jgi:succinate-semialdehyde dehydrogenase/glutarate-semialdehyde dehydrogenase